MSSFICHPWHARKFILAISFSYDKLVYDNYQYFFIQGKPDNPVGL